MLQAPRSVQKYPHAARCPVTRTGAGARHGQRQGVSAISRRQHDREITTPDIKHKTLAVRGYRGDKRVRDAPTRCSSFFPAPRVTMVSRPQRRRRPVNKEPRGYMISLARFSRPFCSPVLLAPSRSASRTRAPTTKPCLLTRTTPRPRPTTRRPLPSSISAATAASPPTAWATCCAPAARTRPCRRSRTWRRRPVSTVSGLAHLPAECRG